MRLFRRNSGMSLVEVMVAAGLGSVVIFGLATAMSQQANIAKRMTLAMDWKSLLQTMRTTYSNTAICTNAFYGMTFPDTTNPSSPSSITLATLGTKLTPGAAVFQNRFLDVNQTLQGFRARSIRMSAIPGVATQTGLFYGTTRKADRVFFTIQATRMIGNQTPSGSDLTSGTQFSDPDTLELTLYKDTVTNMIVGCNSTGNFDAQSRLSGWTNINNTQECEVVTGTTSGNQPVAPQCNPGTYLVKMDATVIAGDQNTQSAHQCRSGEFQGSWSCYCAGSSNSCCHTVAKNCNYMETNAPPWVAVSRLTCCRVSP